MSAGYTATAENPEPWVGSEADSWEFVDARESEDPAGDPAQLPEPVRVRLTAEDYKRQQVVPVLHLGVTDRHRATIFLGLVIFLSQAWLISTTIPSSSALQCWLTSELLGL